MKSTKFFLPFIGILLFFASCEIPKAPNFKVDQKVHIPLFKEQTYKFLGDSVKALIDTTSSDFDSLFTVDNDGLITLSKEEDFDFGDLNDAIPEVDVDPISVNSQVGELKLTDFSSGGSNVGSAGFQEVTGFSPNNFQQGQAIPAGSSPGTINVGFSTDYFTSATIKNDGTLEVTMTNNLGFDIATLNLTLKAGGSVVDNSSTTGFNDQDTNTAIFNISAGTQLSSLSVDLSASWNAQNMKRNPDNLIVNNVEGIDLVASQVQAVVPSQDFTSVGNSAVDDSKFKFTDPSHYIELKGGQLRIFDIVNQIDLGLDTLQISFPDIRRSPYVAGDSLVIKFEGNSSIPANSNGAVEKNIDLSDMRIFAENNQVDYNISGVTEDAQKGSGSQTRTLNETDQLQASVEISSLQIKSATGVVVPRNILLNDDIPDNGTEILDLFEDQEAETIDIDGLKDLSEQLDGLSFADPQMSILYDTNLGVEADVYASIVGISSGGNEVYLHGESGSSHFVQSGNIPPELQANSTALTSDQVLKFSLATSPDGSTITDLSTFVKGNTNVDEFFNNLPTKLRFVGIARLNENSNEGMISEPVQFDPKMSVEMPLYFSSATSSYNDTTDADLSDMPGGSDSDQKIKEVTVAINYTNNLPLKLDMSFTMLDEQGQTVTTIPESGGNPLVINAASVDQTTRFVNSASEGSVTISLSEAQADLLNQTREMIIGITFDTKDQSDVKIRADDTFTFSIKMRATIESTVNNN